ncbi:MAG: hypothetical protein PHC28_13715 [Flavobacterium sp.]|uniref:hypothetical protein n=1 Tax=Flavobacterium sp. TaxID=239 RepID=UPI00261A794C|nr:hypothetical protein [Flavobacterium sp.]MDD5151510.1 hypothetical protein [Flavobacterium sp.]
MIEKICIKSPVLEGIRYDGTNIEEIKEFILTGNNAHEWCFDEEINNSENFNKSEYNHAFTVGNWAIKLISGGIYNITPEMFHENYYIIK